MRRCEVALPSSVRAPLVGVSYDLLYYDARHVMDAGDLFTITLEGGRPWGVRLQGGYEYAQRIRVAKVGGTLLWVGVWCKQACMSTFTRRS